MAISEHHQDHDSYPHGMLKTSLAIGSSLARSSGISDINWLKFGARWAVVGIAAIFWIEAAKLVVRVIAH